MAMIGVSHVSGSVRETYVLHALIAEWRARGVVVEIGADFPISADLCILHHDSTRVYPKDIPAAPEGVQVLNGGVLDISKHLYSVLMLSKYDNWDGPVIVKTNLNSFGGPERRNSKRSLFLEAQKLVARHNWKLARSLPKGDYPILASLADVPEWVWHSDELIVERFLPEREGDLFALRGWLFLGSAGYGYRLFSTDPKVKTGTMVDHEYLEEVPEELQSERERMGFDFGKFDYVVHDGRAYLLDANKTPSFAGDPKSERLMRLAEAAMEFLP